MVRELLVNNKTDIFEIIDGCKNNDKSYQSALYIKYYYTVLNVCKKYISNLHEAEDLTQDIFLKLMNKLDTFKGKSPAQFSAWVKMVSKNSVIDSIRKRRDTTDISEDKLNNLNSYFINTDVIDNFEEIMSNDINVAISNLSPKQKKVFQLYYIENYSHNEIADKLGINVSTSKTNLLKAKLKLSKLLQHYNNSFN
jgi:RNA polymerase sigma-70 factor (ECF subfamily)